ncbi:YccF domain-containing protein [Oceanospirillum sanctuarii]|uniref:YccF domain-containing protein n=1 Tax=Oceanospirillum sanctuarii TaxID=1434821 RepID=UPI000A398068|nr:YccF domain-containing protein [Oceanospirillum sanctuarii]
MRLIGNIIWFVMGGFIMGLAWWAYGVLAFITILGIPWGRSCFVLGQFSFWPFGKQTISRKRLSGREDIGTGTLGLIGNIIWILFAGIWLAIGHLMSAVACAITIIGIPFAIQHLKLAVVSFAPVGQTVVSNQVADAHNRL